MSSWKTKVTYAALWEVSEGLRECHADQGSSRENGLHGWRRR